MRDIAHALGLPRGGLGELRARLRALKESGLAPTRPRDAAVHAAAAAALPEIAILSVAERDVDGELRAYPVGWHGPKAPPPIYLAPATGGLAPPALGERIVARLRPLPDGTLEATALKRLEPGGERILGVFEPTRAEGLLQPTDRKRGEKLRVPRGETLGALKGELVLAELIERPRYGPAEARIVARLGAGDDPKVFSLIALHSAGIPDQFPRAVLVHTQALGLAEASGREDLRDLPLVTIDDADARDFDDAVHAEADPEVAGGFHLTVAIADVAWYVRPGDALDREAERRGNSVYFPDRVVPMLPERLSNDLCSLRPGEERPCLFAELWIDGAGKLHRHRFGRALMRSAARLTYAEVQAAADGRPSAATRGLDRPLAALQGAFKLLDREAVRRGALRLDLPEHKVEFDATGTAIAVRPRPHYDSHRLIEQFMVQANVAAAQTLERARQPCMYRVHDSPDAAKVLALAGLFREFGLGRGTKRAVTPADFNRLLERAAGSEAERLVHETVLRAQAQAVYSPKNLGHFGLALGRYAHFTSPIRRYADVLVHRALIRGLKLGAGGLEGDGQGFALVGQHISTTERRAAAAERDAIARFAASLLANRVGETFAASIVGVTRFGLFVRVEEVGAEGLLPIGLLGGDEFLEHDEGQHALRGRRSGRTFRLGDRIAVRLTEALPLAGRLTFAPVKS